MSVCPHCGFVGPYLSEPEAWREIGAVFERLADRDERYSLTGMGNEIWRLRTAARLSAVVAMRMQDRLNAQWTATDTAAFDSYDWPSRALACYLLALEAEDESNVATLHPSPEG